MSKSTATISAHTGSTACPKILKKLSSYSAVWVEAAVLVLERNARVQLPKQEWFML